MNLKQIFESARTGARRPWRAGILGGCALLALTLCGGAQAAPGTIDGNEWPSWRGPDQNGASRVTSLVDKWSTEDENLLWKAPVGARSTPVIADGRVYLVHESGIKPAWKEETVCLDAASGKILWKYATDIYNTDIPLDRVGWASPAYDKETQNLYVHGVQGIFACLDKNGKVIWEHQLTEEYGRVSGYGGRTQTPIVDQDLVIISFLTSSMGDHGIGLHRYVAFDKRTGEVRWWGSPGVNPLDTNYSTPVVAVIGGKRLLIAGNGDGWVYAMKVNTGEKVWGFHLSKGGINPCVVVNGEKVYIAHGEDNLDENTMGRVVCVNGALEGDITKTGELWRSKDKDGKALDILATYSSPALANGRLYVFDSGSVLFVLDAETGKEIWRLKVGRVNRASPVVVGKKIYCGEVNGEFYIIEDKGDKGEVLSQIQFKPLSAAETAARGQSVDQAPATQAAGGAPVESAANELMPNIEGSAAVAYNHLFVVNRHTLYCLGKKGQKPEKIEIPALPGPGAPGDIASLQIIPAEVHIHAGDTVQFKTVAYDAKGTRIGDVVPQYTVNAPLKGKVTEKGLFTPDGDGGQFGVVQAELNGIKSTGRTRVLPKIPFSVDFENIAEGGQVPWFVGGAKIKFDTVIENGNHIFRKDANNERFRRANAFMGSFTESDYTVQADIRLAEKRRNLADAGLTNSGYVFDLRGNDGTLRIVGWVPMPRIVATVPFDVQKDTWYTLKFRVEVKDGKGLLKGKAWKRDDPEPTAWSIELEDPAPYHRGAPGLACFSMAEVFYDNVKVERNK